LNPPPQLRRARRPKRRTPRPLIDDLPVIDLRVLGRRKLFPGDWFRTNTVDPGLIYPSIREIILTRATVTIRFYGGGEQAIPITWYRPGFGGYRPIGRCACGRTAFRFHRIGNRLLCYRCTGGVYASQVRGSPMRPYVHAARIRAFIGGFPNVRGAFPKKPPNMFFHTYERLKAECLILEARLPRRQWRSRRISERTLRPRQRYCTKAAAHMA
jgi:hypothetical protein